LNRLSSSAVDDDPDTRPATDRHGVAFIMLDLSTVTLLCADSRAPELATWAINRCLGYARFADTVLMTDLARVTRRQEGITYVQTPPIATVRDYSEMMLTGIEPHVSGSHVLVIQWDGFILHPDLWDPGFLDYDYIGAAWPPFPDTPVGNGGFSLRSRKLLDALRRPGIPIHHPEDKCICITNRKVLEESHGIRFAPVDVAERFSVERTPWHAAFGFHGFFNFADALAPRELAAFLADIPDSCCGGVDTYDLIATLRRRGHETLAADLFRKCGFRRRAWRQYIATWLWAQASRVAGTTAW